MPQRTVLFLRQAGYEAAFQAASLGITAIAMGEEVYFVFWFDALGELLRGKFGSPQNDRETAESARAAGLGVPPPRQMLDEARSLGAKLIACDTTLKICGFSAPDATGALDEVIGLASILRLTQGARVISL
jgi:peroxiredoxin family protein